MPRKPSPAAATSPAAAPPVPDNKSDKAVWVCEQLDAAYGAVTWHSHGDPLDTLIVTMLSQHTSDRNCERAFDDLRRRFPTWDDVRLAPVGEIADAIRAGGLADAKAPRIRRVLEEIHEKHGTTDLDFLDAMPTEEIKAYLTAFHGVGPKTTACVLMFSMGRPVLPVDTHVFRVSHRLGLIPRAIGEAKAHSALEAQLPPERVYSFHVHLIRHGRRVCVAQNPRCGECVLRDKCDYFRDITAASPVAASDKSVDSAKTAVRRSAPVKRID